MVQRSQTNRMLVSSAFAGLVSAIACTAMLSGGALGVLLGSFAPLPLFYTAMLHGSLGVAVAAGLGFVIIALQTPGFVSVSLFGIAIALAPFILGWRMERETGVGAQARLSGRFIGKTLMSAALICGFAFATALINLDEVLRAQGGVVATVNAIMNDWLDQLIKLKAMDVKTATALRDVGKTLVTGFGASWLSITALNAGIATVLLKRHGRLGAADIAGLTMPRWMIFPLIAGLILSFSAGSPGLAAGLIALTLVAACTLQGLAVVHSISRRWPARKFLLGAVYVLGMSVNPIGLLLALLGAVDTRMDVRKRLT